MLRELDRNLLVLLHHPLNLLLHLLPLLLHGTLFSLSHLLLSGRQGNTKRCEFKRIATNLITKLFERAKVIVHEVEREREKINKKILPTKFP